MNHFPKVIIQILHFRDISDTLECLHSVFKLDYPNYEVLVIDNSGKEVPPEPLLENFHKQDQIHLIKTDENKGFAGGHNIGFDYSIANEAEFIWVLNNDCIVLQDTLQKLVDDIELDSKIGAISPIIYYYGTEKLQYLASIIDLESKRITYTISFDEFTSWEKENKNFCLWGTALLIRTAVLKEIGFFDDNLFAYWEDTDLSYRMLIKEIKTSISIQSCIYHKSERANGISLKQPHFYFYMIRNELLFLRKNCTRIQLLIYSKSYLINILEKLLSCQNNHDQPCINAALDGIYCGLKGIIGPWNHDIHMPKYLAAFVKTFSWKIYKLLSFFD